MANGDFPAPRAGAGAGESRTDPPRGRREPGSVAARSKGGVRRNTAHSGRRSGEGAGPGRAEEAAAAGMGPCGGRRLRRSAAPGAPRPATGSGGLGEKGRGRVGCLRGGQSRAPDL